MSDNARTQLQEALKDPTAGPRPISLEEYRRRQVNRVAAQRNQAEQQVVKKPRSGKEPEFQRQLQAAQRELILAATKEDKRLASQRINKIKMDRRNYRHQKKLNKIFNSKK